MQIYELILIAVGLAMDAFAVSISKGLSMDEVSARKAAWPGLWFGGFQALMPILGFLLGIRFQEKIKSVDHWIAFAILAAIGFNMIREARREAEEEKRRLSNEEGAQEYVKKQADMRSLTMLFLAVATSMDALAIGISFAMLQARIIPSALLIGCITFGFSYAGVYVGHAFGIRFKKSAAYAGGIILILIGLKILLEHLGILAF